MPAVSQQQRRFIYAVKGKAFAKRHHFDNKGKLPKRAGPNVKANAARALKAALKARGK